jgi:hypothetical protein
MGACYNTILVPVVERETIFAAIGDALRLLGCRIVHREEPTTYEDGFRYRSVRMIFVGQHDGSGWTPLSSWGDGLPRSHHGWYRMNPLALALSWSLSPVVYLFSFDAGWVTGYSVFQDGRLVEAQSLTSRLDRSLGDFASPSEAMQRPSRLGALFGDSEFDYEAFASRFRSLEVAAAALAGRLGAPVHLIDPLDVQDGDGAIVVEAGKYKRVRLAGWAAVYYEPGAAPLDSART